MSEKEIMNIIEPYMKKFGLRLVMRNGVPDNGQAYDYIFIDDLGINIRINPNNKHFSFSKMVDVFVVSSGDMSPLDYKDHFHNMYCRFRRFIGEHSLF